MEFKNSTTRVDSYRHKGLRKRLIKDLEKKGIQNVAILEAMSVIPRHFFLDSTFADHAYEDKAFPIGNKQTISQPYTVAFMTELLQVEAYQKVLEIGTGSGYQAAVLGILGASVYTIERQEELHHKAKNLLPQMGGTGVHFIFGDGTKCLKKEAPFDRIIVTAGAPVVPETLMKQLKIGGILVIPVGEETQEMMRYKRISNKEFSVENFGAFRFVPFLEDVVRKK